MISFNRTPVATFILGLLFVAVSVVPSSGAEGPRVFFTEPTDKMIINSPVKVTMGVENFTVEPAGTVKNGAGHLHIMVDTDCIAAGRVVPKDDTHLHYGKGQMEAHLQLSSGPHTLCLQAADGAHVALSGDGLTNKITIVIK